MDFQNITYDSPVKEEFCSTICNGCLSRNRNLTDLDENTAPYWSLLGQDSLISPSHIALCWECTAMLRKMRMFQQRVQHAHNILQQSLYPGDLISLSTLTKVNLDNTPDDTKVKIEDETENTISGYEDLRPGTCKEYQPEVLLTDIKIELQEQPNIKSEDENDSVHEPENSDLDYEPDKSVHGSENSDLDHKPDKKNLTKPIETNKTVKKILQKIHYKFSQSIENKDLDINNIEKNFTDICLSEEDMGSLSLGEKRSMIHHAEAKCLLCKIVFDNDMFKQMHDTFYHSLGIDKKQDSKCNVCKKSYGDIVSLREHWMTHGEAATCNLCGFTVDRKYKRRHLKTHKYYLQCRHCDAIFQSRPTIKYHYETIHARSICDVCNAQYRKKHALIDHMRRNHLPFKCKYCGKVFETYKKLYDHTQKLHKKRERAACKPELAFCVECNKQFASITRYKHHLRMSQKHNLELLQINRSKVSCPECGKQFCSERAMKRHYDVKHKGVTNYQCEICHKYLIDKNSLEKHMKGVHLKIRAPKNKICDLCGRDFTSKQSLDIHRRIHTGEKPFKCPQCPATFRTQQVLVNHGRTHTGERPFKCPQCPAAFSQKYSVVLHLRTHTGERPYKCPQCPEAFNQKNLLVQHMRKKHKVENPKRVRPTEFKDTILS